MRKEVIIIAGGNGVGKTTFAREFLLENSDYEFLNTDEIAKELSPDKPQNAKISAGKIFFKKLREHAENGRPLLIESTLAGRYLINIIALLNERNYKIRIIFLFVDSPDILIERVKNRVSKGGHFVPDDDIRRRFKRGKDNFIAIYRDLVNSWALIYNIGDEFNEIAVGENKNFEIFDQSLYDKFLFI